MDYIQGDLIKLFKQGQFDVIGHQCNCFGVMSGGIAGAITREWPKVIEADKSYETYPSARYGNIVCVPINHIHIVNLYSQFKPGSCTDFGIDSLYVRLGALRSSLSKLKLWAEINGLTRIGLPLLGSGIAADTDRKKTRTDLEYFIEFIGHTVESNLKGLDVTIVYL